MPQSLVQIYVHIVYSTKGRAAFLQDKLLREDAHAYLAGIANNQHCPAIIVGGAADHVHLLCRLGSQADISSLIRELKRDSSTWIKDQRNDLKDFYWQRGYGAFSVSPSHVDDLTRYIRNQEEHHKRESFQDEFRRLCTKYGVAIDERYVWD